MLQTEGRHWTERSTADFAYRISFDFAQQIEGLLEKKVIKRAALAKNLKVSKGRVSQVLNDPGNLGLLQIVKYARSVGRKVSVVMYDDHDPQNMKGPINSEIFTHCWEKCGSPSDFFALEDSFGKSPHSLNATGSTPLKLQVLGRQTEGTTPKRGAAMRSNDSWSNEGSKSYAS